MNKWDNIDRAIDDTDWAIYELSEHATEQEEREAENYLGDLIYAVESEREVTNYALEKLILHAAGHSFDSEAARYIRELEVALGKERKLFDTALNKTR